MDHTAVTFKLEAFEGPLDLLLHLIVRNKVDIMDIPVAMILDQYLEYLDQMQEMDMEVAGDFILMASQLIFIKTKMLLPDEDTGEEEDPRAELAATLLEYRKIKQAGIWLGTCQAENAGYYSKIPEPQQPVSRRYTYSHSPMDLVKAIHEMTERAKQAMPPPLHMFDEIVEREPEPIEGKINWITGLLKKARRVSLKSLFRPAKTRSELVAVFLAVLELFRMQKVDAVQESDEDENSIVIEEKVEENV